MSFDLTPRQAADKLLTDGKGYATNDGNLILEHKAVVELAYIYNIEVRVELVTNNFEKQSAVIRCTATDLETKKVYQSFGEVHPKTNSFDYYIGVCEKRATDRAILKCLGLHGDFMSEIENEIEFKKNKKQTTNSSVVDLDDEKLKKKILSQKDETDFNKLIKQNRQWLEQLAEKKSEAEFFKKLTALQNKLTQGVKPNGRK